MKTYYSLRAQEYEKIYHREDPIRQGELAAITTVMKPLFCKRKVLEIACGTGFWTERVAPATNETLSLDASVEVLEIARSKDIANARFVEGDAYDLERLSADFDGAFANFWFSHIPKARIHSFLKSLHSRLKPGAVVFMADNVYIEGIGGELLQRDDEEDTFKLRTLDDGSTYEVLKNYFTEAELRELFNPYTQALTVHVGRCYWWLSYTIHEEEQK